MREISYAAAIAEATVQAMEENPRLFVMGEGVDDPKGAFGTTTPALERFGKGRVFDSPLSESALTGIAVGAAMAGSPCIYVHMRSEFALLGIDQIVNHAAKWRYMSGGAVSVPLVIRCLIGRGWGQAAQHSQSFHSLFAAFPGLKVILPSSPADAKGLLASALRDGNPVLCFEHRWLYDRRGPVPEIDFREELGQARVVAPGRDVTCVTLSYGVVECSQVREQLLAEGIEMELIDLRCVRPLDFTTILSSLKKTGRLFIHDISHTAFGFSGEIVARVAEVDPRLLRTPVLRSGLPDSPTPCSAELEKLYYPQVENLVHQIREWVGRPQLLGNFTPDSGRLNPASDSPVFQGPF